MPQSWAKFILTNVPNKHLWTARRPDQDRRLRAFKVKAQIGTGREDAVMGNEMNRCWELWKQGNAIKAGTSTLHIKTRTLSWLGANQLRKPKEMGM